MRISTYPIAVSAYFVEVPADRSTQSKGFLVNLCGVELIGEEPDGETYVITSFGGATHTISKRQHRFLVRALEAVASSSTKTLGVEFDDEESEMRGVGVSA